MNSKIEKKHYNKPEVVVHGDFEKLTQKGGGNHIDVPIGTVVNDTPISSVTS